MIPKTRDLLLSRTCDESERGKRNDPWHLALVIEGGGMRGVVSGGMVSALEERGMLKCFDSIHGSSAGACAGAYFAAGQARLGTRIYYEDINNRSFIKPAHVLIGRPIMDTSFLIDSVMRFSKPLNVERIVSAPGFMNIVTTDTVRGEGYAFCKYRSPEHFFSVLKATITMPIIAGHSVTVDSRLLVDGGIVQQIPLKSAIESGATHALILLTRTEGELERPEHMGWFHPEYLAFRIVYGAKLAACYMQRNPGINATLRTILGPVADRPIDLDTIVRPAKATPVARLEMRAELLKQADREARDTVWAYLDDRYSLGSGGTRSASARVVPAQALSRSHNVCL